MISGKSCAPTLESLEARMLLSASGYADLAVSNVAVEGVPTTGSAMTVAYDVSNLGDEPGEGWQDMIQVSRNSRPFTTDPAFVRGIAGFGAGMGEDPLAPGETVRVTAQVQLFTNATGRHYVVVMGNWEEMVDEGGQTANNTASTAISIVLAPPIDLTPTELTVLPALRAGRTSVIAWTVENLLDTASSSFWTDEVYFSRDAKLGRGDVLLGTYQNVMPLAGLGQYAGSIQIDVPDSIVGAGYLIVKVNAYGAREGSKTRNNTFAQAVTVEGVQFTSIYSGMFLPRSQAIVLPAKSHLAEAGQLTVAIDAYTPFPLDTGAPAGGQTSGTLISGRDLPAGAWTGSLVIDTSGLAFGIYTLSVRIDQGGDSLTRQVRAVVVEQAIRKNDKLGDTVGGDGYEHFNIDAGRVGDALVWRVGTNHWYDDSEDNGDFLLEVDRGRAMTRHGVALADRTTESGATVAAGGLYSGAVFTPGGVVPKHLAKIDTFVQETTGNSFVLVLPSIGTAPWAYDMFGGVKLTDLNVPKIDQAAKKRIVVKHTMWCGNDLIEIELTTLLVRWPMLPAVLPRPKVTAITAKGDKAREASIVGPYAAGTTLTVAATVKAASAKDPVVAVIFDVGGEIVIDPTPRDKWTFPFEVGALTADTPVLVTAVAASGLSSEVFQGLIRVA